MVEPLHPVLNAGEPDPDRDLATRMELFGLDAGAIETRDRDDTDIVQIVECVAEDLCHEQLAKPDIARLINGPDDHHYVQAALRALLTSLLCGDFSPAALAERRQIGHALADAGADIEVCLALSQAIGNGVNRQIKQFGNGASHIGTAMSQRVMFETSIVLGAYMNRTREQAALAREDAEDYADSLEETVAEQAFQLAELARKDVLTGLHNQRAFLEHLSREISHAERHKLSVCLVRAAVNEFSQFNAKHGHIAGDTLLAKVGHTVGKTVREGDLACRNGEDRFSIILPRTSAAEAKPLCDRLVARLRREAPDDATFSLGVGEVGPEAFLGVDSFVATVDELLDIAIARSKSAPGDHIEMRSGPSKG